MELELIESLKTQISEFERDIQLPKIGSKAEPLLPYPLNAEGVLVENNLDDEVTEVVQLPSWAQIAQEWPQDEAIAYIGSQDPEQFAHVLRNFGLLKSKNYIFKPETKSMLVTKLFHALRGLKYLDSYRFDDYHSLPIAELHCPHVKGCVATYKMESEKTKSVGFKVSLLGAELGGGSTLKLTLSKKVSVESNCLVLAKPCKYEVDRWIDSKGKHHCAIKIISVSKGVETRRLPLKIDKHFCSSRHAVINKTLQRFKGQRGFYEHCLPYSLESGSRAEENFRIRTGFMIDISGELKDPSGVLSVVSTIKSEVLNEFEYEFGLSGGFKYIGFYRSDVSASYMWAWGANGLPESE